MNNYKLILVGDGGIGKTTYVKRLLGLDFEKKYVPTLGVETKKYKNFTIWDTAGMEKFSGLKDGYYIGAHCAIIMMSNNIQSFVYYINLIKKNCGDIPIAIVFNTLNLKLYDTIKNMNKYKDNIFICSVKDNANILEPINYLNLRV
jgi:GTP-binding nuclear protein Ran